MKVSKSFFCKIIGNLVFFYPFFYLPYLREYLRLLPTNVTVH